MSVFNLDQIFRPRAAVVVGATPKPGSVGSTLVENLLAGPASRSVYGVNPKYEWVRGAPCYPSVADLPEVPDLALLAVPSRSVPAAVRACGEAGIRGLVIISAGFREAGENGAELEKELAREVARFDGMRVIGPNCLGLMAPHAQLNASFAADAPEPGRLAFVSQSGALCTAVLDWAKEEGVGFSYFVSIGNMMDVDFGDLIDYIADDPQTDALILYVESVREARKFVSAARAMTRTKPIITYKAGRHAAAAQAAASHTGALAGEDAVYDAAFARAGIVRILNSGDMFDCAGLLARHPQLGGERLGILTNAGGPGVMATDALLDRGGELAELGGDAIHALGEVLPGAWSRGNPVDVLGDASPARYRQAAKIVAADAGVDATAVILTPQAMTDPTASARALAEAAEETDKPVLAAWMGGASVAEGARVLRGAGIPTYATPEQAIDAFTYLVSHRRNQEILYEAPRDVAGPFTHENEAWRFLENVYEPGFETLSEHDSKALLELYGIPSTRPKPASSPQEAAAIARELGYPVVLKIRSPDITHKTDVDGVALDLDGDDAVRRAYDRIVHAAATRRPDARVEGVTVQRMATSPAGFEILLGVKKDPTFGTAIAVGTGGVAAEIFRDRSLGLPPLNERLARRMLESLRAWPLLCGYRGRPRVDIDSLIQIVVRFSYLAADLPQVAALDVNPLLVTPQGAIALDARVLLDREVMERAPQPYEHLAIRPYPLRHIRESALTGGAPVTLRPIRPEDTPAWLALLGACSETTLRRRFGRLTRRGHELAARYCFIDYDREMALVAETEQGGERSLIGVGRLVAGKERAEAEFSVLVADAWHGRGLGGRLTDACLEVANEWGTERVVAVLTRENTAMRRVFERRGFELSPGPSEDTLTAVKPMR